MTRCDPAARPALRLGQILWWLARYRVEYIIAGSVVLAHYGAAIAPNDLDVVPNREAENLKRLGDALAALGAVPAYVPDWKPGPTHEECEHWSAEPSSAENLDHLFVTTVGLVDVVPRLAGTFEELSGRACTVSLSGHRVLMCDPLDVLRRIEARNRAKDAARAHVYAQLRQALNGIVHAGGD